MAWKPTGRPLVRQQRDKWVVRVDGLDTETSKPRPRQLGTYKSRRAAQMAATEFAAAGDTGTDRSSVGFLVDQWVASRTDVASKTKMQYEWAAGHIRSGLGSIRLDRLDRSDVAQWLDELAAGGKMGRRSISIFRMVLRAALADAVDTGELRRSPASRVAMPRVVVKPDLEREVDAWDDAALAKFLAAIEGHRWDGPLRLAVMYGLRRSELLGLGWSAVDLKKGTVRIERALVEVHGRPEWSDGKNARSRRKIPIDPTMVKALTVHRRFQAEERLAAGAAWNDNALVVATKLGNPVSPGNFDQTLERLVAAAGVPRLTSHGLRHTAATHMVRHADDIGEIRAAADLLGHSPDMLMKVYAHALPESVRTVTDKIGRRAQSTAESR
ncbi:MAG: site-specific integrase [Ilumatobacteraceae bacterium]